MANLGDHDISEKSRILALVFLTLGSILATTVLLALAQQWWIYDVFREQSTPVSAALHMALWGGFMFAFSRARPIGRGLVRIIGKSFWLALHVPLFIFFLVVPLCLMAARMILAAPAALLRIILGPGYEVLCAQVRMHLDPLLRRIEALRNRARPLLHRIAQIRAAMGRERKLRRAYRTEFQSQFESYRAFRAHFDALGCAEEARKAKEAAEPFRVACRLLGLSEDGKFSEQEFKARYRTLMKSLHPDVAGPNARAADVNAASVKIKERKGWS